MANNVQDRVLDYGLDVLDSEADAIYICSQEPSSYAEATSTYALGSKNFGAGGVFGSPAAGTPNGRAVVSAAVLDGAVSATDTATHFAVVDTGNSRLLAVAALAAPVAVTDGNQFTLGSFTIRLPSE